MFFGTLLFSYNKDIEGIAIATKIIAGIHVQIISKGTFLKFLLLQP